jgi:acyl-coenzyme A thioesterase PaaI-like protein
MKDRGGIGNARYAIPSVHLKLLGCEIMNDDKCFVCGHKNSQGLNLRYEINKEGQSALCRTVLSEAYEGWKGFIHGGIAAAILDGAMVHACLSKGLKCVTAKLDIRYKNPIPTNKEIEITSQITKSSSILLSTIAEITVDGVIAASANAKMYVVENLR